MNKLRSYHCNTCGAWLLVGEKHTCEPERIDMIDRITHFLSQPHQDELDADELHKKAFPLTNSTKDTETP